VFGRKVSPLTLKIMRFLGREFIFGFRNNHKKAKIIYFLGALPISLMK